MKNHKIIRIILLLFVFSFTIVSSGVLLTGCGSSANAKDEKARKKKKKQMFDLEDEDDLSEENANSGEKDKDKDSENSNSPENNSDIKKEVKKNEEAEAVWSDLMKGNERFVSGKHTTADFVSVRRSLAKTQKPEAVILGCADSRVPPELVFDKNLGELFVVRAAGNIADPISLGSIEYAVEHLKSKVIVVLGHESCGAVAAAVSNEEMPTRNLSAIVNKIAPALEDSSSCPLGGEMKLACVELNVDQSAEDILKSSPIIKEAIKKGELTIIRAVYMLESGKVLRRD